MTPASAEPTAAAIREPTPRERLRDGALRILGMAVGLSVIAVVFGPAVGVPLAALVWSHTALSPVIGGWAIPAAILATLATVAVIVLMLANRHGPRQICVLVLTVLWVGGLYLALTTSGYAWTSPPPLRWPDLTGWLTTIPIAAVYLGIYGLMFKDG